MSKTCSNCQSTNSLIEEQKSKIHLLETRLKDLVRAYKVVCKERDNLQTIISSQQHNDIDARQQKRIAELEESVCELSSLCGKLELGRKQDKDRLKQLQDKYEHLSNELDQTKQFQKKLILSSSPPTSSSSSVEINFSRKQVELRNNFSQTDLELINENSIPIEYKDKSCQTENESIVQLIEQNNNNNNNNSSSNNKINETKINKNNETAIVTPLLRNRKSESELSDFSSHHSIDTISGDNKLINDDAASAVGLSSGGGISLFHINELARKELELADYRLRVREAECSLRELQWNYTNDKYKYQSRIADLELLNKNLMTSNDHRKHQFGLTNNNNNNNINVAYIKNVLAKLLDTTDHKQRQLMINALITALDSMQTSCK